MKFLLVVAAMVAVAVAGTVPVIGPVSPVAAGPEPIFADPSEFDPVSIGPLPVGGPIAAPSPVIVNPAPVAASAPLVQIILNINQAAAGSSPVPIAPVIDAEETFEPVSPVQVVDIVPVSPVQVVDIAPVPVEPVIIGTPVFPSPAVILPEELN